ncbi:EAL domain-containing protein [Marinicella rhabdoformis]|uniref:EAL domain-containing protein n=1 Tax=Marinicella rhabdoformis TaxID=2580566 RepID=UPI0012AEB99B|nr:EAL domain-containing protein [Marinicella rhabdoformis]
MNLPEQQINTDFNQYELQAIMADSQLRPTWYELLYRPSPLVTDVESYFSNLSDSEKIAFDTALFKNIPSIQKRHMPHVLSININPASLLDECFLNLFSYLLDSKILTSKKLCIEIVESDTLPELPKRARQCLKLFKSLGGLIALDDFGTGNTHWELIHSNLIDIIKIAAHKHKGDNRNKILKALSGFSNSLQLKTVFEGIETKQDLINAQEMGATHFQGWYFNQWKLMFS